MGRQGRGEGVEGRVVRGGRGNGRRGVVEGAR